MCNSRKAFILVLIVVSILETIFVGCGAGGNENSSNGLESSLISTKYRETSAKEDGSFSIPTLVFNDTSVNVYAPEKNTIAKDSKITLSARPSTISDKGLFGIPQSEIYKLVAVNYNNSNLLSSKQSITTVEKPIVMEIKRKFPANISDFYLATRSEPDADWQYSKLSYESLSKSYTNSPTDVSSLSSSRMAVTTEDVNYTFSITTYHMGQEITIVYDSTGITGTPATGTPSINSIAKMTFATDLPYLDLKLNENGKYVYNTDLVITTCLESTKTGAIFTNAKAKTIITFLSDNSSIINSLQIVGNSTRFADQYVSDTRDGAGNKYTHRITFDDYTNPAKSGRNATYTFTLKIRNIPLDEFPETFLIKTIFTDTTPITYNAEANITREKVLSYFEPVSPTINDGKVSIGSNLVMKYIAHDIASVSVNYKYSGLRDSITMPGTYTADASNHKLTFYPSIPWPTAQTITASLTATCCSAHKPQTIKTGLFQFQTDEAGNGSVTVGTDTYEPVSVSMQSPYPTEGADVTSNIVLKFSDVVSWMATFTEKIKLASGSHPLAITTPVFDNIAKTITFKPVEGFKYYASYSLVLEGFVDNINKKIISTCSFSFSTADGIHATADIIASATDLVNGLFLPNPTFIIDFGKDVCKSDQINDNLLEKAFESIKVYKGLSNYPIGNLEKHWVKLYNKIALTFKVPLEANASYTIKMDDDVLDYENLTILPFAPFQFNTLPGITTELVTPADSADVGVNTDLEILFSSPITWVSSYSRSINLFNGRKEIPTQDYTYNPDTRILTFKATEPLFYNASYTVLVAPGLINTPTKQQIASNAFYFSTCDTAHIQASVTFPDRSKTGTTAIMTPTFIIDFGESVLNSNVAKSSIRLKKNGILISAIPSEVWKNNHRILELTYSLEPDTDYVLTMDEGVKVFDGRFTDPFVELPFKTAKDITVALTTPAVTTDVDVSTSIVFTFSEDIAWSNTEEDRKIFFFNRGLDNISSALTSFNYATSAKTLTINPGLLQYNASYTIGIDKGLVNRITGQKIGTASFYFETMDGVHQNATITLAPDSILDGKTILKPTFTVDFGKKLMNESASVDTIKLYKKAEPENILTGCFVRQWQLDRSKLNLIFTTALQPDTEYLFKMTSPVKDIEGIPVDPFAVFEFSTVSNITAELIEPADSNNASVNTRLGFKFSNNITWNEANDADKIRIWLDGQQIAKNKYDYSEADKTLTVTLKEDLLYNTAYTARIMGGLSNNATAQSVATASFVIKTVDGPHEKATVNIDTACVVTNDGGNERVSLKPTIYIDFKKSVLNSDTLKSKDAIRIFKGFTEVTNVYKHWDKEYNKLKITFSDNLEPITEYRITMEEGIRNYLGILIAPFDDFVFTTQNTIGLSLISPVNTDEAPIDSEIKIKFDSPIDWITGEKNKFTFKAGNTILDFDETNGFTYDQATCVLTVKPADPLLYNTTYTLSVKKGIKHNATLQQTEATTFEFTTCDGNHSQAVLMVSATDKVNELLNAEDVANGIQDMLVVTPTFVVDFCKTVSNEVTAINSIRLFSKGQDITQSSNMNKAWVGTGKKQLQISFNNSNMLNSSTIYELIMSNGVTDTEGTAIEAFTTYVFKTTPNGSGTEANPFHIYTAAQLDNIRQNMQSFYVLKKDISIATTTYTSETNRRDYGWLPIGDAETSFGNQTKPAGLDGNNHIISGLRIRRSTATIPVGLFGRTVNAKLENIVFSDAVVIGEEAVGCLVGIANTTEISRCATEENCRVIGVSYVGGICGTCYSTNISKCKNSASVTSTAATGNYCGTGGITGWNNMKSRITCCYNKGIIKSIERPCGGIAGHNSASIVNCCNDRNAYVESYDFAGGIAGKNVKPAKIDRCLAFGNIHVTNLGKLNAGGIAGYTESDSYLTNNVISNATQLNGVPCQGVEKITFNYNDKNIILNNNYYFGTLSDLYTSVADPSMWSDGNCFDSLLWTFTYNDYPAIKDLP